MGPFGSCSEYETGYVCANLVRTCRHAEIDSGIGIEKVELPKAVLDADLLEFGLCVPVRMACSETRRIHRGRQFFRCASQVQRNGGPVKQDGGTPVSSAVSELDRFEQRGLTHPVAADNQIDAS